MNEPITVVIPGPPVGKQRPRLVRKGAHVRAFTPDKTANYEANIRILARSVMRSRQPTEEPVKLTLRAVYPIPRSWTAVKRDKAITGAILPTSGPDLDNVAKSVADGLNEIVYLDDSQIVQVEASKVYGLNPFVVATVSSVNRIPETSDGTRQDDQH